jgi:hypothetical protein
MSLKYIETKDTQLKPLSDNLTQNCSFQDITDYLNSSEYLHYSTSTEGNTFLSQGWVVYPYCIDLVKEFYDKNWFQIYYDGSIKGLVLFNPEVYDNLLWINLFDADDPDIIEQMTGYCLHKAAEFNCKEICLLVPQGYDSLLKTVNRIGYSSWEKEMDFFLYELPLEILERF